MKRISLMVLLALVLTIAPARADSVERTDFRPVMSDGVGLEASVYLPAGVAPDAALPLIVRQHGGGSNKDNAYDVGYVRAAVETGRFAALMYSHRGHGGSDGLFDFFGPRTTADFSEMLDAVESSFGARIDTDNVGVSGYSQGGGESLLPAASDGRVKAAAVGQTFANLNHALNPNDCFKMSWATGIFTAAYKSAGAKTQDDLAARWGATLYTDTEDVSAPGVPSTTDDLNSRSPDQVLSQIDIPVFWTQAWEDQLFPADHPQRVLEPLRARGVPVHYWFSSGGHAAGPNFPADESAREAAMVSWFDEFLLDIDHGYESGTKPLVDYWQRTAPGKPGAWAPHSASAWPIPSSTPLSLYPHGDGELSASPAAAGVAGRIVNPGPSANLANDSIVNEVVGRAPGMGDVVAQVPEDPDPLNTIRFTSTALTEQVDVTGAPVVSMPIETTAPRVVQVSAKVWDVAPGSATLVWRGCGSYQSPGAATTVELPLWPNSHVFGVGHKIVLTLSATDVPMFKPDTDPAVTTILHGARLDLPRQ